MSEDKFIFPELDEIGIDTLDAISFAPNFNKYMFDTIAPFCSGRILEIGAGIGNISQHFINQNSEIHLSDIRDNYISILKQKYSDKAIDISKIDIASDEFDTLYSDLINSFDTVFALNVVEHIENDRQALKNIKKLLKPGGHCVILVPAYNALYNTFDKALEHYRRYTKKSLIKLMQNEFKIHHKQYFNVFGILGWVVSGKILKKKTIPRNQMELYDKLILVSKTLDKMVMNKIGLSVICVGKK